MTATAYREHNYVPDTFWLVVAALLFAACGLVWLIGQVAAILFGAHRAPAGPAGRHARRPAAPARHLGRPRQGLATRLPAAAARPGGHVRRRRPHLLAPRPRLRAAGPAAVPAGPPPAQATGRQVGEPVAAAPAAGAGAAAGADHPRPPRPHPRPPPRPPLPGRRAMPLGAGLRATGIVQDPRAGHPGHPGMAGQPGHHLHQTRRPAGHLRPPGQPRGRLGLRPPRPRRRPRGPVDPARLLPHLRRRPPDRPHAGRGRRRPGPQGR